MKTKNILPVLITSTLILFTVSTSTYAQECCICKGTPGATAKPSSRFPFLYPGGAASCSAYCGGQDKVRGNTC